MSVAAAFGKPASSEQRVSRRTVLLPTRCSLLAKASPLTQWPAGGAQRRSCRRRHFQRDRAGSRINHRGQAGGRLGGAAAGGGRMGTACPPVTAAAPLHAGCTPLLQVTTPNPIQPAAAPEGEHVCTARPRARGAVPQRAPGHDRKRKATGEAIEVGDGQGQGLEAAETGGHIRQAGSGQRGGRPNRLVAPAGQQQQVRGSCRWVGARQGMPVGWAACGQQRRAACTPNRRLPGSRAGSPAGGKRRGPPTPPTGAALAVGQQHSHGDVLGVRRQVQALGC